MRPSGIAPRRTASAQVFLEFWKVMAQADKDSGISLVWSIQSITLALQLTQQDATVLLPRLVVIAILFKDVG